VKIKHPKWTILIVICISFTAYYFIHKAIKYYRFQQEEIAHHAYRKNCGNPPNIDIVANKDHFMDKSRIYLFDRVLNHVTPRPRETKSGRMSYFVPSFRAMYLSPLSAKDYKQFITLIEGMDIHKSLKENFKIVAGIINDGGKVRYFIADQDVSREEYITFFKNNLRKFSILHDEDPINPIKFIPLQDGLITFEEKADIEADPYPPMKYLTHYLKFPFYRYCCDIDSSKMHANYMNTKRISDVIYTLKDIPDIAAASKNNPNLIRQTSDIELIGQIGRFETKDYVLAGKSTPVEEMGKYGHQYSDTVDTCHSINLK